jgi:hypothetical protein
VYNVRSLPYIIGSQLFNESPDAGLGYAIYEEEEEDVQDQQELKAAERSKSQDSGIRENGRHNSMPENHHRYSDSHSDLTDDNEDNHEAEGDDVTSPRSPARQPPPPPRPPLSIADALAVRVKQQPQLPTSPSVASHRNKDEVEDENEEDNKFNDEPVANESKPVLNIKDALAGMMGKPRPSVSGTSAPVVSSALREIDNDEASIESKPTQQKKPAVEHEKDEADEEEDDDLFGTNDDPYSLFGNRKSTVNKVAYLLPFFVLLLLFFF